MASFHSNLLSIFPDFAMRDNLALRDERGIPEMLMSVTNISPLSLK